MATRILLSSLALLCSVAPLTAQCEVGDWAGSVPFDHGFYGDACSIDGTFAVVGSPGVGQGKGRAFLYRLGIHGWTRVWVSGPEGGFSGDVRYGEAVDAQGQDAIVGAPDSDFGTGDAYFLRGTGSAWGQFHITPEDPTRGAYFGYSISMDGDHVAIGAPFTSDG